MGRPADPAPPTARPPRRDRTRKCRDREGTCVTAFAPCRSAMAGPSRGRERLRGARHHDAGDGRVPLSRQAPGAARLRGAPRGGAQRTGRHGDRARPPARGRPGWRNGETSLQDIATGDAQARQSANRRRERRHDARAGTGSTGDGRTTPTACPSSPLPGTPWVRLRLSPRMSGARLRCGGGRTARRARSRAPESSRRPRAATGPSATR